MSKEFQVTREIVRANKLHTVCEEAACPNIGECWTKRHATMMIMGDTCTRACAFCNVKTGLPAALDADEPANVARAVKTLGLAHVVITSVDRDDLADGGAQHFADVIRATHASSPGTSVEVLTPDFLRKEGAIETLMAAQPEVFNHNLETVPRLYLSIRPGARYFASLRLLQRAKELMPTGFTKSGLMVGLGETREEIMQVMDDLRAANVDFLTIGQYLQPTRKHARLDRFWSPEEFASLESIARAKGFLMVSASPLTRSSYHADSDFAELKAARSEHQQSARRRRCHEKCEAPEARSGFPSGRATTLATKKINDLAYAKRRIVPYPAELMYRRGVRCGRKYPEFLPWVVALRLLSRKDDILMAEMAVGYGALRERYTSDIALDPALSGAPVRRAPRSKVRSRPWRTIGSSRRGNRAAKLPSPSCSSSKAGYFTAWRAPSSRK